MTDSLSPPSKKIFTNAVCCLLIVLEKYKHGPK
jgi:hypothetical protein